MKSREHISIRLPADVLADIDAIAEATNRSRGYIIVRAVKTYLLNEGSDVLAAIRGRGQIAAGEYENMDDLTADVDAIIGMPRFSLDDYDMLREPGETDEEYAARLALFTK